MKRKRPSKFETTTSWNRGCNFSSKMFVSDFEEIVPIQFVQRRRDLVENKIDKFMPPALVVVLTRSVDGGALRHLVPR